MSDIGFSNAAAESGLIGFDISPTALARRADKVQSLGEMPWVCRATAFKPDLALVRQTRGQVNTIVAAHDPAILVLSLTLNALTENAFDKLLKASANINAPPVNRFDLDDRIAAPRVESCAIS